MDGTIFLALSTLCSPLVHPATAQAIVATESMFNPYAIGVVASTLLRQPSDIEEAVATAQRLRATGWNFSVGLAQINVHNLGPLGLSIADAFDGCKSLGAMQAILIKCYERGGAGDGSQVSLGKDGSQPIFSRAVAEASVGNLASQKTLRRALSCYYSGNFSTGFRQGYVSRVVASARKLARAPP